jgi:hypothetical protein
MKRFIRRALKHFGLEVRRIETTGTLMGFINDRDIEVVLDIGANVGSSEPRCAPEAKSEMDHVSGCRGDKAGVIGLERALDFLSRPAPPSVDQAGTAAAASDWRLPETEPSGLGHAARPGRIWRCTN